MSDNEQGNGNPEAVTIATAKMLIDRLMKVEQHKQRAHRRRWTLGFAAVLVLFGAIIFRGHQIINQVQHASYVSCIRDNSARMANLEDWKDLILLARKGDKRPKSIAAGNFLLHQINENEKLLNCRGLYTPSVSWWEPWQW